MKKVVITLLTLVMLLVCRYPARGEFIYPETQDVPIDRLIGNLERRLTQNTNDAHILYYLARLEAMAASTQVTNVAVFTKDGMPRFIEDSGASGAYELPTNLVLKLTAARHSTNSIRHFERVLALLPNSTNQDDRWLILPTNLGYGWTLNQAGRTNDAIRQYRKTLELAWNKEVGTKMDELMDTVRATIREKEWSGWQEHYLGMGVCFSEETIGYLLKILDPVSDAKEIADLTRRQTALSRMSRKITPVAVPIAAETDLTSLITHDASVSFDLDGSGLPRRWGWINDRAAWLVWDPKHTGKITSGLQLFGAVTFWIFWRDGYEPLAALDDDDNGVLEGHELDGLALWHDLNGNGISDPGEVRSVAEWGIVRLQCHPQRDVSGMPFHPEGVTFSGGTSRPTYDWSAPLAHEPVR